MSLDVTLYGETKTVECRCPHCDHKHSREDREEFFSARITHNLNDMAEAAGIYEHLWSPGVVGIKKAVQLIEPLSTGLDLLRSNPARFKAFNLVDGWGTYDGLVQFVDSYLEACKTWPDSEVCVSR